MDEETAAAELGVLADAGVTVAIDDFGTGYSSLSRLTGLPVQVLKIDRSFVQAIDSPRGRVAVDVIVHLAHALGMRTVAEGVETQEQLALLREAGSDAAAGYLLGRPAPADDLPPALHRSPLPERDSEADIGAHRYLQGARNGSAERFPEPATRT